MTYKNYMAMCANYGFASTPITEAEFNTVIPVVGEESIYGFGCDIANGWDFDETLATYTTQNKSN